ncbi:DUF1415 domain-containing protein [Marinobacter sp. SS21]|uniref:DUF1415 domain-containing protein n=1 Tax=Marinobacter sp. SS21 TaxID=2979460 RepID=UPI00232B5865|nr:DUF1415 domain-containing protein [Marinobacter sp. SS21]MDC0661561.1 DUF1415 domain-containing protein [Marinobacter sp. SS21]
MNSHPYLDATRQWVERVVIDLNLCPFAKRELVKDRIRFAVTEADSEDALVWALQEELQRLDRQPEIETTLLIHPRVLTDFQDYIDFLAVAEGLLTHQGYEGIYQIASFHPHYQFEGTAGADAENYTNRSPYPVLHLLREASLSRAIDQYPDVDAIPQRNIQVVDRLGAQHMKALLRTCCEG